MGSCFPCFGSLESIWNWYSFTILRWLFSTLSGCVRSPRCSWWCLCCEKWLCILVMILILVVTFIVWLIVEILVVIVCTVIAAWCLICRAICWIGCLGNQACYDNCLAGGTCDVAAVEIDWDLPGPPLTPPPPAPPPPVPPIPSPPPPPTGPIAFAAHAPERAITTIEGLKQLGTWRRLLLPPRRVRIELGGAGARHEAQAGLQAQVNLGLVACGCTEGTIGMLMGVALGVLIQQSVPTIADFVVTTCTAAGFMGVLLGKALGILRARAQVRRAIQKFITAGGCSTANE